MKSLFIASGLFFCVHVVLAQTELSVEWTQTSEDNLMPHKLIGQSESHVFFEANSGSADGLAMFSLENGDVSFTDAYVLEYLGDNKVREMTTIATEGKLWTYITVKNKKEKRYEFYTAPINDDYTLGPVNLISVDDDLRLFGPVHNITLSTDSSKTLALSKFVDEETEGEPVNLLCSMFEGCGNLLYEKTLTIGPNSIARRMINVRAANNGDIVIVYLEEFEIEAKDPKDDPEEVERLFSCYYNHATDQFTKTELHSFGTDVVWIYDLEMEFTKDGKTVVAGFYGDEASDYDPTGIIYVRYDPVAVDIPVSVSVSRFDEQFRKDMMPDKHAEKEKGISYFGISRLLENPDGSITLIGEENWQTRRTVGNRSTTRYSSGHIGIFQISVAGEVNWSKFLWKRGHQDEDDNWIGHGLAQRNNKLYFFMNRRSDDVDGATEDDPKYTSALYTVDKDGGIIEQPINDLYDAKMRYLPKLTHKCDDRHVVVLGVAGSGNAYRVGRITLPE